MTPRQRVVVVTSSEEHYGTLAALTFQCLDVCVVTIVKFRCAVAQCSALDCSDGHKFRVLPMMLVVMVHHCDDANRCVVLCCAVKCLFLVHSSSCSSVQRSSVVTYGAQ